MEGALAILMVFGMPIAIIWIKRHYAALEKGVIKPRQGPLFVLGKGSRPDSEAQRQLETLHKEKRLLEERVRNLESIVCSVDMELNARLNRLAAESRSQPALGVVRAAAGAPGRIEQMVVGTQPTVPALRKVEPAPAPAPVAIAPGRILLGRYHVERELGRGGMGAVFLARDAQLGEQVALKVIAIHRSGEGLEAAERFRREAQAARKITHPNVIRIHDLGEDPEAGELFLSMEYFQGVTLGDLLRRRGALPLDEAREILAQVCDGLEAAHRVGVIHRDLKPGNILCNERRTVKIIDFGLAKASFMAGMTATGLIMGTPEYMAPEQVRGRDVDARTDIYSLGAVAYHVLCGLPPFSGDSPIAIGFAHCTQPLRPARELRPELPVGIEAALARALAKEPRDRYETVAEMRGVLCA
jgi:serine/threonine-protein kinase